MHYPDEGGFKAVMVFIFTTLPGAPAGQKVSNPSSLHLNSSTDPAGKLLVVGCD